MKRAYLPAAGRKGKNVMLKVGVKGNKLSLETLPVSLPYPAQFALGKGAETAYINEPGGALYRVDLNSFNFSPIVAPLKRASCVGLACGEKYLYSAWEHECGGTVAIFDFWGKLKEQYDIAGIPTNVILDNWQRLLVTFTNTAFTGEGVAIFKLAKDTLSAPQVITIQCPGCPSGLSAYPCHLAVTADGQRAYLASEDSASVLALNLKEAAIADRLVIGRSISRLYLTPQSHIAVATSNFFNDLCRIDLQYGEITGVTETGRQILSYIAILPED
jgi:hypothetical protein